jgi:hypothetical protein
LIEASLLEPGAVPELNRAWLSGEARARYREDGSAMLEITRADLK